MLIEKSVNISTEHTRAHSAEPNIRRASLTLHHCCSIMHHKTSSSQFSSRSHFIEKGNEKHGASEVKQSWHSAMSQSSEEKTSFYFMFRCRFQLEVKNKKLSNQTGRNAVWREEGGGSVTENETKCTAGSHVDANTSRKTWKTTVGRPNTNSVTLFQANHE